MPVKRDASAHIETPHERGARQSLDAMLARIAATPGSPAFQRARMVELIEQPGKLAGDEKAEWKLLVKSYRARQRKAAAWTARSDAARQKWAARAGTPWAAKWEARAAAESNLAGAEFYWLHVVTEVAKTERKQAKRDAREATRDAAKRDAPPAPAKVSAPGATTAAPRIASVAVEATAAPESRPRPRRRTVGVVAQYNAAGYLVGD